MKPRVVIPGATGFSGRHMVDFCLAEGLRVYASARQAPDDFASHPRLEFLRCDFTKAQEVDGLIRRVRPTYLVNLVAHHNGGPRAGAFQDELIVAWNLLRVAASRCSKARLLLVGSCAEYGLIAPAHQPVSERHPLQPMSWYGLFKLSQELLGLHMHKARGIPVYLARTFNLIGPGQPRGFVAADLAAQYRSWHDTPRRTSLVIRVGDAGTSRDFLDVRDAVRAYWFILQHGRPGRPYNVCFGRSHAVRDLLRLLDRSCGVRARVKQDARLAPVRSRLVRHIVGDNHRLRSDTSWAPTIPLEASLRDMLQA